MADLVKCHNARCDHWHKYIWTACSQYFCLNFALSIENDEASRIWRISDEYMSVWTSLAFKSYQKYWSAVWAMSKHFHISAIFDNAFRSRESSPNVFLSKGVSDKTSIHYKFGGGVELVKRNSVESRVKTGGLNSYYKEKKHTLKNKIL